MVKNYRDQLKYLLVCYSFKMAIGKLEIKKKNDILLKEISFIHGSFFKMEIKK